MNKKMTKDLWNTILNSKKILSDKEADEMKRVSKSLRKEFGFRKPKK